MVDVSVEREVRSSMTRIRRKRVGSIEVVCGKKYLVL